MSERGESSASSSSRDESLAAASSSSTSSPQVQQVEDEGERDQIEQHPFPNHDVEQQHIGITDQENSTALNDATSAIHGADTCSCIFLVFTFWFFVSLTLVQGVYGSVSLRLGPSSSILVQPYAIFVQSLKVETLDDTKPVPLLYGFYKPPALDVVTICSKTHNASVAADSHREWLYNLNEGSQINISYSVNTPEPSIFLVIAEGKEGLTKWLKDPTHRYTTLSWNIIHGAGMIHQDIYESADYYVAVGNMNTVEVEVKLVITATAYIYNTTEAYYKCTFSSGECRLDLLFASENAAVLATPSPGQGTAREEWYVRISYGTRWIAYILGIGGMSTLMVVAYVYLNKNRWAREGERGAQHEHVGPERAPLLSHKDDDLSSLGSSYDSTSQDEKDAENGNNSQLLCVICFDAPRDCFFLPCGHCVACLECGTRIMEDAGTCPVCRRNMKKVRKIYTV